MPRCLIVVFLVFWAAVAFAAELPPDVKKKHEQILYPVVRVSVANTGGSGTILYSEDRGDGCQTYVLTNHHVISDAIKVRTEWSSLLQADVKREVSDEVKVEVFRYDNGVRQDFADACSAVIVAHDASHDLALLRLKTDRKLNYVAKFPPPDIQLYYFRSIWAVGCTLGHSPVATDGIINNPEVIIEYKPYCMGSAQIAFGNSGGAVFTLHEGNYYFIGVPSRVAGTRFQILPHMGYFVPLSRIIQWCKDEKLDFLIDPKVKPSDCFALREKLRKEAEAKRLKVVPEPTPATSP